jgi:uncharacterized membrane protein
LQNPEDMTERKLTPEQIDELYAFCRKHYVNQYDLQIELVDHIASSIEEQWDEHPKLAFQDALNNTFGKFGIFGFAKVREQKQKALERKYRNLLIKFTLEYYRLPKLILTIACTLVLFTALRLVHNPFWIIITYFGIVAGLIVFYMYWLYPRNYKIKVREGMSFMVLDYLKDKQFVAAFVLQIPIQSFNLAHLMDYHLLSRTWPALTISFLLVLLTIFLYISLFILPIKVREHFTEQFPEFVKS